MRQQRCLNNMFKNFLSLSTLLSCIYKIYLKTYKILMVIIFSETSLVIAFTLARLISGSLPKSVKQGLNALSSLPLPNVQT
jgi:hypothetical protein